MELRDTLEKSDSEPSEEDFGREAGIDLDLSHEDHNLIDFDASVLTVDLPRK